MNLEMSRSFSVESMLGKIVLKVSAGKVDFCSNSRSYRDVHTGQYLSREYPAKICERESIRRALRQGSLFARTRYG